MAGPPRQKASEPPAATLALRVQPRASRNGVVVLPDGSLKVRLAAPPVDGAANEELVRRLAQTIGVGRSAVEIVSGRTGRRKVVRISGISSREAEGLLKKRAE